MTEALIEKALLAAEREAPDVLAQVLRAEMASAWAGAVGGVLLVVLGVVALRASRRFLASGSSGDDIFGPFLLVGGTVGFLFGIAVSAVGVHALLLCWTAPKTVIIRALLAGMRGGA